MDTGLIDPPTLNGPSEGTLHPQQFHITLHQPEPSLRERIKGLAATARGGPSTSDIMHTARDLANAGHQVAQNQLRGATVFRGSPDA